jgi:chromosome segregation ATPase
MLQVLQRLTVERRAIEQGAALVAGLTEIDARTAASKREATAAEAGLQLAKSRVAEQESLLSAAKQRLKETNDAQNAADAKLTGLGNAIRDKEREATLRVQQLEQEYVSKRTELETAAGRRHEELIAREEHLRERIARLEADLEAIRKQVAVTH